MLSQSPAADDMARGEDETIGEKKFSPLLQRAPVFLGFERGRTMQWVSARSRAVDAGICGWKVDRIKIKTRETQLTWRKSQKAVREQVSGNVGRCVMLK